MVVRGLLHPIYGIGLVLLMAVEVPGLGDISSWELTRWLNLGFTLRLQPSEVMKIGVVLALARYYHGAVV
jgi:rod shape determining protein RodA